MDYGHVGQYGIVCLHLINPKFNRLAKNFQITSQGLKAYDVGLGVGRRLRRAALRLNSGTASQIHKTLHSGSYLGKKRLALHLLGLGTVLVNHQQMVNPKVVTLAMKMPAAH